MEKNITVLGGDLRSATLANLMSKDNKNVFVYGMEKSNIIMENKNIVKCSNIGNAINSSNIIIGSIPFLKTENEMYAVFSDKHIKLDDLINQKNEDKIFIAGSISENAKNVLEKSYKNVIDIMKSEELAILNTIATAEGAIEIAIKNTDKILQTCNVLILGFGRVGKMVARKFEGLCSNVCCAARKSTDLAWIKALGYKYLNINNIKTEFNDFDIIINTVPQVIIKEDKMKYMKKDVLLIDLASFPGGFDKECAKKLDLNLICALALPGKVAPITTAEFLKQTIYKKVFNN